MGDWKIIVPIADINMWTNPSAELSSTGFNANGAGGETISQSTERARYGYASVKVVCDGTAADQGVLTSSGTNGIAVSVGSTYTFGVHLTGSGTITTSIAWWTAAGAFISLSTATNVTLTTSWKRYYNTAVAPATAAFAAMRVVTASQQASTFYGDGWDFKNASVETTHTDGDQPGCTWAGLRHASTSSRSANYRLAGQEVDIQTQYGIRVRQFFGAGAPEHEIMTQELALQPGAVYLRDKIGARTLTLVLDNNQTSLTLLHSRRKAFWNVISPDALGNGQPFLIGYSGGASGKTVYGAFRYAGGWGIDGGINGGRHFIEAGGEVALRLLAVDPFWYADDAETATLDFQDSITSNNNALARIGGAWQNLGTGFSDDVYTIVVDNERGRVYFGGPFVTANGVTVNGVCYWNGSTFVAMGGTPGVGGVTPNVNIMALAPNGDLWIGGPFTSAGGAAADGLARWNVAAETWTNFTNGAGGDVINSLAIDKNGLVYIGGNFTNWDGNANSDYIVSYDGSAFAPLSTGTNGAVLALAIGLDGTTLYLGGSFTTPQTRVMSWNGTAFSAMSGGASDTVYTIAVMDNGDVLVGGAFVATPSTGRIAAWHGSAWASLGSGVNGTVYKISKIAKNEVMVSGNFTAAGGLSIIDRVAYWNGSAWYPVDADPPSSSIVYGSAVYNGNIYIGYTIAGTALAAGRTTVAVLSTATVYPIITITGPTSGTATLQWLENQTTGDRLYFNLTINTGEIITIDLRPQNRKVTSNWRGQIFDQPLPTSDFSSWHLVTGDNVIAAFMTGTITGATMVMNWQKIHSSIDGEAA